MESFKFESAKNTVENVKDKIKKYAIYFAMFASSCTTAVKTEGSQDQETKNPVHNEAQYKENVKLMDNLVSFSDNMQSNESMNTYDLHKDIGTLSKDQLLLSSLDVSEITSRDDNDIVTTTGVHINGKYIKGLGDGKNQLYNVNFTDTNRDGQADLFRVEEEIQNAGSETNTQTSVVSNKELNRHEVLNNSSDTEAQKLLDEVDLVFHEMLILANQEQNKIK